MTVLKEQWLALERELRESYGQSGATDLFLLIAKGKQFFEKVNIKSTRSFSEQVTLCCKNTVAPALAIKLARFLNEFMPRELASALQFKSYIHEFASVPNLRQCDIRSGTVDALFKRRKVFVGGLRGFKPPIKGAIGRLPAAIPGPVLSRLFDKTVFHNFQFLQTVRQSQ